MRPIWSWGSSRSWYQTWMSFPLCTRRGGALFWCAKMGSQPRSKPLETSAFMVLEEGHWHGITCLKVPGEDRWCVSITGVQPEEDVTGWDENPSHTVHHPSEPIGDQDCKRLSRGAGGMRVRSPDLDRESVHRPLGLGPSPSRFLHRRPSARCQDSQPPHQSEELFAGQSGPVILSPVCASMPSYVFESLLPPGHREKGVDGPWAG